MNRPTIILAASLMLLAGCQTKVLITDATTSALPPLTDDQIEAAGLSAVKDNVYIVFKGNCPESATPVVSECDPPLGNATCRRSGEKLKFTPIPDASEPDPAFGIIFENIPDDFYPCGGPLGAVRPGVKNCKIPNKSSWPGGGTVDLIIKYTVKANGCKLDPYLVLRR